MTLIELIHAAARAWEGATDTLNSIRDSAFPPGTLVWILEGKYKGLGVVCPFKGKAFSNYLLVDTEQETAVAVHITKLDLHVEKGGIPTWAKLAQNRNRKRAKDADAATQEYQRRQAQ